MWAKNRHRLQQAQRVLLSDRSAGMLQEARDNLSDRDNFSFAQIDVQDTGLPGSSIDLAIANHMLYHVADRSKALREIQRVLRPGGLFYAAANGQNHLGEMYEWVKEFDATLPLARTGNADKFGLENGQALLSDYFAQVNLLPYVSGLRVTAVADLVAYLFSMDSEFEQAVMSRGACDDLLAYLETRKQGKPYLAITKSSGMFVCIVNSAANTYNY